MQQDRQSKIALRIGIASAAVAVACTIVLIADHAIASARATVESIRVEEFENQVKTEAATAATLHEERERQTDASLVRKSRNRALAWIVLVAGSIFIASGKRFMSLQSQPLPALDELVTIRFPPANPAVGKPSRRKPQAGPEGGDDVDLTVVDELVARFGTDREAAIPILQAIQNHYRYLPDDALLRVCETTDITPAQIAGTSSFYAQFRRSPVGRHVVRVCHGTACHVAGAEQITRELLRHLEIPPGEDTDPQRLFTLDAVACVGCCSLAPVMMIEDDTAGRLTPATARQTLDALVSEP